MREDAPKSGRECFIGIVGVRRVLQREGADTDEVVCPCPSESAS